MGYTAYTRTILSHNLRHGVGTCRFRDTITVISTQIFRLCLECDCRKISQPTINTGRKPRVRNEFARF